MGLGLAICYSVIQKHEGHLAVASEPGHGTQFDIYLPADPLFQHAPETAASVSSRSGRSLLVMDDEESVRKVARNMLSALGYQVELAENGEVAIEKYERARSSGQSFDAVILDLTVRGGMGGRETMARLLDLDPSVRGILSSGYTDDPAMSSFAEHGFRATVPKPFNLEDLRLVLQRTF